MNQTLYHDLIEEKQFNEINNFKSSIIVLISFLSKKMKLRFKSVTFYNSTIQIKKISSNHVFGYFQDKTFLKKRTKKLLELGGLLKLNYQIKEKKPIVVHYRKGDSEWATRFSSNYNNVKELLKKETKSILIVTDSIEHANFFFIDINNIEIICSKDALEDFKYLVLAKKLYCAPSTFSWWAAHSVGIKSEVIMPHFFKDTLGVYTNVKKISFLD